MEGFTRLKNAVEQLDNIELNGCFTVKAAGDTQQQIRIIQEDLVLAYNQLQAEFKSIVQSLGSAEDEGNESP